MIALLESPRCIFLVGLLAGACTTFSFVPQVIQIWKRHSADDISAGMFATFSAGSFLWLLYGFQTRGLPLIIANGVTLGLSLSVLLLKWSFKSGNRRRHGSC